MFKTEVVPQLFSEMSISGFAFDTELIVRAFSQGLRVKEVPIIWTHGTSSKVRILREVVSMGSDILSLWYYHHFMWKQNKATYPTKKGSVLAHLLYAILSVGLKQRRSHSIPEMRISEMARVEPGAKAKVEPELSENEVEQAPSS